jgi:hypothetical protein
MKNTLKKAFWQVLDSNDEVEGGLPNEEEERQKCGLGRWTVGLVSYTRRKKDMEKVFLVRGFVVM